MAYKMTRQSVVCLKILKTPNERDVQQGMAATQLCFDSELIKVGFTLDHLHTYWDTNNPLKDIH